MMVVGETILDPIQVNVYELLETVESMTPQGSPDGTFVAMYEVRKTPVPLIVPAFVPVPARVMVLVLVPVFGLLVPVPVPAMVLVVLVLVPVSGPLPVPVPVLVMVLVLVPASGPLVPGPVLVAVFGLGKEFVVVST